MAGLTVRRGDIVLIVAAGEIGKPRPAVVVQADALGDGTTSVIVCPLSSDIRERDRFRPIVEPRAGNALRLRSQVMTDKIVALPRSRIRRVVGSVDADTKSRIDAALLITLGLVR